MANLIICCRFPVEPCGKRRASHNPSLRDTHRSDHLTNLDADFQLSIWIDFTVVGRFGDEHDASASLTGLMVAARSLSHRPAPISGIWCFRATTWQFR